MRKGIFIKTIGIVFVLVFFRFLIDFIDIDFLPEMNLIACFVGGTLFVMAFILASVVADFKESEKIADDLPVAITNLYLYSTYMQTKGEGIANPIGAHVKALLSAIVSNLKHNEWNQEGIHSRLFIIINDIQSLKERNMGMEFISDMHTEVVNIFKMLYRIDTIVRTKFIPALYLASYVTVGIATFLLLFAKIVSTYQASIMVGCISFVLIFLLLLMLDMENPFEVDKNTVAEVDLTHLFDLQEHLEETVTMPPRPGR